MKLIIRDLNQSDYLPIWEAMRTFTEQRDENSHDEIWLLEHKPVFTQGQAGKAEHLLSPKNIAVIQTDRGGQVTYHGPGQLMLYTLFDLKRLNIGPRQLVMRLEQTIIDLLHDHDISANGNRKAPGIYVDNAKIGSIGLRVRRSYSYHGIALNVNMDLTPFSYINPCGFKGLRMTQISHFQPTVTIDKIKNEIIPYFSKNFGYTSKTKTTTPWSQA